jgi:hypothetical protein
MMPKIAANAEAVLGTLSRGSSPAVRIGLTLICNP